MTRATPEPAVSSSSPKVLTLNMPVKKCIVLGPRPKPVKPNEEEVLELEEQVMELENNVLSTCLLQGCCPVS